MAVALANSSNAFTPGPAGESWAFRSSTSPSPDWYFVLAVILSVGLNALGLADASGRVSVLNNLARGVMVLAELVLLFSTFARRLSKGDPQRLRELLLSTLVAGSPGHTLADLFHGESEQSHSGRRLVPQLKA